MSLVSGTCYSYLWTCGGNRETKLGEWMDKILYSVAYEVTLNFNDGSGRKFRIEKETVVVSRNGRTFDRLAEKKIRTGLKEVIQVIKRDQNQK